MIFDIMKIWRKRISDLISDEAVYRTAPATPGLLKTVQKDILYKYYNYEIIFFSFEIDVNNFKLGPAAHDCVQKPSE
jgi:hypothetical protein